MTGNDVIEDVIRQLLSGSREEMNKLAANVGTSAASLTFEYALGGIREGAHVSIGTEVFRVWSVNDSSKTAVVQPAMAGSTTSAHTAGDLVYVNPRLPRHVILDAMNKELMALTSPSNGLYTMDSDEFTYNAAVTDYELPAEALEPYKVTQAEIGPSEAWPQLPHWSWDSSASTTEFASGKSIHLPYGQSGRTVRVLYKKAFTPLTDPTLDLSTTGMPASMHDIVTLGVLLRLGPVREIKRNFTEAQGDSRRAEEVPPGSIVNSFSWVRNLRQQRIAEERLRLEREHRPERPC